GVRRVARGPARDAPVGARPAGAAGHAAWDRPGRRPGSAPTAWLGPAEARLAPVGVEPLVEAALRLVAAVAVALLDAADELVVVALGHREVVVGELAPLLLDGAPERLPVALQNVPVHERTSLVAARPWRAEPGCASLAVTSPA